MTDDAPVSTFAMHAQRERDAICRQIREARAAAQKALRERAKEARTEKPKKVRK